MDKRRNGAMAQWRKGAKAETSSKYPEMPLSHCAVEPLRR